MAFGESIRALEFLESLGLLSLLDGELLDIGAGLEPVLPRAMSTDLHRGTGLRFNADASSPDLTDAFEAGRFDCVYSSHCLEHMFSPIGLVLAHWLRLVKPGGFMVLYLPDENYYRFDPVNPTRRNPEHLHYLTMDSFSWHLDQLQGAEVLHLAPDVDVRHGKYSFLAVLRKS